MEVDVTRDDSLIALAKAVETTYGRLDGKLSLLHSRVSKQLLEIL